MRSACSVRWPPRAAIGAQPRAPQGYVYRGMERAARGDQAAAELNFSKAMELAPGDSTAYVEMAKLRSTQKRPQEAQMLYQEALAHNPNSADALNGLVLVLLQEKQPGRALAAVREQI